MRQRRAEILIAGFKEVHTEVTKVFKDSRKRPELDIGQSGQPSYFLCTADLEHRAISRRFHFVLVELVLVLGGRRAAVGRRCPRVPALHVCKFPLVDYAAAATLPVTRAATPTPRPLQKRGKRDRSDTGK